MSDELKDLAAALSKAQADIMGASKDSQNPFFKSRYADLASIWAACRGPLTKNGLSVVQLPGRFKDGCVEVTTILLHASGQSIRETISTPVPPATNKAGDILAPADPQIVGSAITYLRRYALAAMVGVAPEEDDGEASSARNSNAKPAKPFYVNGDGEVVLPGDSKKWDGHGGKVLSDPTVPTAVLTQAYRWCAKELTNAQPLMQAMEDELERRRDAESEAELPEGHDPANSELFKGEEATV